MRTRVCSLVGIILLAGLGGAWGPRTAGAGVALVFENPFPITIPDSEIANPYPSTINVAGQPAGPWAVEVVLSVVLHNKPDDLDILLVGPNGATIMLISDAGGTAVLNGVTATFTQQGGGSLPPDEGHWFNGNLSGVLVPSNYGGIEVDEMPAPAPVGGGPYGTSLNALASGGVNGAWRLYVRDDTAGGAAGGILGGWALRLTPIPAPGTLALLAMAGLLRGRRRQPQ